VVNGIFVQIFSLALDFRGGFCGLELGEASSEALAEAGDGLDSELQLPRDGFGFGDASPKQGNAGWRTGRRG